MRNTLLLQFLHTRRCSSLHASKWLLTDFCSDKPQGLCKKHEGNSWFSMLESMMPQEYAALLLKLFVQQICRLVYLQMLKSHGLPQLPLMGKQKQFILFRCQDSHCFQEMHTFKLAINGHPNARVSEFYSRQWGNKQGLGYNSKSVKIRRLIIFCDRLIVRRNKHDEANEIGMTEWKL